MKPLAVCQDNEGGEINGKLLYRFRSDTLVYTSWDPPFKNYRYRTNEGEEKLHTCSNFPNLFCSPSFSTAAESREWTLNTPNRWISFPTGEGKFRNSNARITWARNEQFCSIPMRDEKETWGGEEDQDEQRNAKHNRDELRRARSWRRTREWTIWIDSDTTRFFGGRVLHNFEPTLEKWNVLLARLLTRLTNFYCQYADIRMAIL